MSVLGVEGTDGRKSGGRSLGRRAFLGTVGVLAAGGVGGLVARGARQGLWAPGPPDPTGFLPRPGAEDLRGLLSALALTPSAMNSQPWRVEVVGDTIELRLDRSRVTGPLDATLAEAYVGLGCAAETLRVAAAGLGMAPAVALLPDPNDLTLAAVVDPAGEQGGAGLDLSAEESAGLFEALAMRRTFRGDMLDAEAEAGAQLPPPSVSEEEGRVRWFTDAMEAQAVRALTDDAARALVADPVAAAGVDRWLRLDPGIRYRDGLGPDDLGLSYLLAARTRLFPPETPDRRMALWARGAGGGGQGGRWGAYYGPVAGEGGGPGDARTVRSGQVQAGMGWMRFWLRATAAGLSIQPVNGPLRLAHWGALNGDREMWQDRVREALAWDGRLPHLVFRIGVPAGDSEPRALRRDLDSFLTT